MATTTLVIDGITIEVERGGPRLWHVFARSADASISGGPFKTRRAAIGWALTILKPDPATQRGDQR